MVNECFKAVKISEKVYWVGAIDWSIRNFHGYRTGRGTTYNAFLILDDKVTLIDTVKAPFFNELMARISSVIDPAKIDYIVSNHSEMDHSGALPLLAEKLPDAKIFASNFGVKNLKSHFGENFTVEMVKTGDVLNLGRQKLHFVESRMLHWPDSMLSYLDGDKILFSQDAFGMHLAGSKLFADQYPHYILETEAKKYYANILLHLSNQVAALLESFPNLKLDVQMLAPDHGPLWRRPEDISYIMSLYSQMAAQKPADKAIVVYSTMWQSTAKIALAIADGIRSNGTEVEVISIEANDRSEVITQILDAGIVAFGAPTMNNQYYPAMGDILTYVKGLKPKNKIAVAFGSFGWSGEGHKLIQKELESIGFELPFEPLANKYVPTENDLQNYFNHGVKLSEMLKSRL